MLAAPHKALVLFMVSTTLLGSAADAYDAMQR